MKISIIITTLFVVLNGDLTIFISSFTLPAKYVTHKTSLRMGLLINNEPTGPEETERDHMGLLKSKSKTTGRSSRTGGAETWTSSSGETEISLGDARSSDPDDITQAVQMAVDTATEIENQRIPVRFVNFDGNNPLKQTVVMAREGENILKVGDTEGIHIPNQCRSGLCGSCTADVKDPNWDSGARPGYQTIRTCQAGAMIPAGCDEMIIDLYRMMGKATMEAVSAGGKGAEAAATRVSMGGLPGNFGKNWEDDFVPDYKSGGAQNPAPRPAYAAATAAEPSRPRKKKVFRQVPLPPPKKQAFRQTDIETGGNENDTPESSPMPPESSPMPKKKPFRRWKPASYVNIAPWDSVH